MNSLDNLLIDIGRIGMGCIFLFSILLDIKARAQIFELMQQKNVPQPWLFYIGALCWKAITSIAIIFNVYIFWAAILLAIYIFIANHIFNNFWRAPKDQQGHIIASYLIHLAVCFGLLVISGISVHRFYFL